MKYLFSALLLLSTGFSGMVSAHSESAYPFPANARSPIIENVAKQATNRDSAYPLIIVRSTQSKDSVISDLANYRENMGSQPDPYRG